jgi:hypothetical protein
MRSISRPLQRQQALAAGNPAGHGDHAIGLELNHAAWQPDAQLPAAHDRNLVSLLLDYRQAADADHLALLGGCGFGCQLER